MNEILESMKIFFFLHTPTIKVLTHQKVLQVSEILKKFNLNKKLLKEIMRKLFTNITFFEKMGRHI